MRTLYQLARFISQSSFNSTGASATSKKVTLIGAKICLSKCSKKYAIRLQCIPRVGTEVNPKSLVLYLKLWFKQVD